MPKEIGLIVIFVLAWVAIAFSWSHNAAINAAENVDVGWHYTTVETRDVR